MLEELHSKKIKEDREKKCTFLQCLFNIFIYSTKKLAHKIQKLNKFSWRKSNKNSKDWNSMDLLVGRRYADFTEVWKRLTVSCGTLNYHYIKWRHTCCNDATLGTPRIFLLIWLATRRESLWTSHTFIEHSLGKPLSGNFDTKVQTEPRIARF